MAISSIGKRTKPEQLHALAIGIENLKEANLVLQHRNCLVKTRQMVLAKILLFKRKKLRRALKKQEFYTPEIIGVISAYFERLKNVQAAAG